jgi:preprotein translocase subunit SecG
MFILVWLVVLLSHVKLVQKGKSIGKSIRDGAKKFIGQKPNRQGMNYKYIKIGVRVKA